MTPTEEIEEGAVNGNLYHAHELEERISLGCSYYPEQSTDSV